MYHYALGYEIGSCGKKVDHLVHENKYSQSEFEAIIYSCVESIIVDNNLHAQFRQPQQQRHNVSYFSIHDRVVEKLIAEHGFTRLDIQQSLIFDNMGLLDVLCTGSNSTERLALALLHL